jgi:hypothetical protein
MTTSKASFFLVSLLAAIGCRANAFLPTLGWCKPHFGARTTMVDLQHERAEQIFEAPESETGLTVASSRINVKRDATIRVSQKLLYRLHIFSVRLQDRAEGMTEGVPDDVLVDADLACSQGLRLTVILRGVHDALLRVQTANPLKHGDSASCARSSARS